MRAPALGSFGRFAILGRLATGGMAEIFLAREEGHAGASRLVVLKRILPHVAKDPAFVEMFLHEARLAMRIRHPNVCAIYEFGEHRGIYFIAMEWVHGVSITQMHKATFDAGGQGLPMPYACRVTSEVASALATAHTLTDDYARPLHLVHRDVTPDNIMVGFDGSVKLLDFGVAKARDQRHRTEAGTLKGKFAYMPPEQYRCETLDGRADIFALGTCLYEALTGYGLFHRDTDYETMGAILSDEPATRLRESAPTLDVELERIVARAVEKDAARRYPNAETFACAIDDYLMAQQELSSRSELSRFVRELCPETYANGPALETDVEVAALGDKPLPSDVRAFLTTGVESDVAQLAARGSRRRLQVALMVVALVLASLSGVLYVAMTGAPTGP